MDYYDGIVAVLTESDRCLSASEIAQRMGVPTSCLYAKLLHACKYGVERKPLAEGSRIKYYYSVRR
jgi:predicted transcriptional regulator